jgi:hypothetical protein
MEVISNLKIQRLLNDLNVNVNTVLAAGHDEIGANGVFLIH